MGNVLDTLGIHKHFSQTIYYIKLGTLCKRHIKHLR